jgi:hypothetical protein
MTQPRLAAVDRGKCNPAAKIYSDSVVAAASALGITARVVNASTEQDLEDAFAFSKKFGAAGLVVIGEPFFDSQRDKIVALAQRYQVGRLFALQNPGDVSAAPAISIREAWTVAHQPSGGGIFAKRGQSCSPPNLISRSTSRLPGPWALMCRRRTGLINAIGQNEVQAIMSNAFRPYRLDAECLGR